MGILTRMVLGRLVFPARFWAGALLLCVVLLHASAIPMELIDDAYISFRYAWHLSQGHGLVFNLGEPVEGYSNLTWVLIAAGMLSLGVPLEAGLRCVAVVFLAVVPILIQAMLARIGASLLFSTGAGLLLAASTAWMIPMLNGLEGALFSLLLVAMTWFNWQMAAGTSERMSARVSVGSASCGLLLAATRPEGIVLYLFQLGVSAAMASRTRGRSELRPHLVAISLALGGFVALTAWRYQTYGSLIPNTVLAKMGSPYNPLARVVLSPLGHGFLYCLGFIRETLPLWILAAVAAFHSRNPERRSNSQNAFALPVVAAALLVPAFVLVLANNGDWMPDFRLLAPYLPLMVIGACGLLARAPARFSVVALSAATLVSVAPGRLERPSLAPMLSPAASDFYRKLCGLGADIHAATRSLPPTVVAVEVLGVFGYCAPLLSLRDLNGLTDRQIALHEPSSGVFGRKTRATTLEAMRPDLIMHSDLNYLRILLEESPWFSREFSTLSCPRLFGDPLYIYVFVRRDSPLFAPGALPICPLDRISPAEAFTKASCDLKEWPYAFPRACPGRERVALEPTSSS